MRITLSTNGALLDSDAKREAALFADAILFSIDGIDDAMMNLYQRGARFDRAYGNMRRLVEFRDARGRKSPLVEWKYVLFNWNDRADAIRSAVDLARKAGVDLISFWPTRYPINGIDRKSVV